MTSTHRLRAFVPEELRAFPQLQLDPESVHLRVASLRSSGRTNQAANMPPELRRC